MTSLRPILPCLLLAAAFSSNATGVPLPSDASDPATFGQTSPVPGRPFDLVATIVTPAVVPKRFFIARVGHSLQTFGVDPSRADQCPTNAGDHVRLKGEYRRGYGGTILFNCLSVDILGPGTPESPLPISGRQFYDSEFPDKLVSLNGTVRTVRQDEIDPDYNFLTLNCDGEIVYITLCVADADPHHLAQLSGADVTAVGIVSQRMRGHRSMMGRSLSVAHASDISIHRCNNDDLFQAPSVTDLHPDRASDLLFLGRHRAVGTVLATWSGTFALIKTDTGDLVRLTLRPGDVPKCGTCIEASGFPETDFSHLCLSGTVWRPSKEMPFPTAAEPSDITAQDLFVDAIGRPRLHPEFHGRLIRLRGIVATQPHKGCFTLSSDNQPLLVEMPDQPRAVDSLVMETQVEVAGFCIMDAESWRPDFTFPYIRAVRLVPRTAADIRIIRRPPWWTPFRLTVIIGSLLLILFAILIWNAALRRLAAKRGRERAAKTIAQTESELKVYERTRLATELHDSIAQALTGVAFKLETADRLALTNPTAMRLHLGIAIRSLQSCRDNLRDCLWDLRNHALEIPEMNQAIRRTMEQHLEGTNLVVRFNVPRERFSDSAAHEILCIIRELVLNAIRHGHASEIRVAGAIEGDILRFSISDNGCGFDPDNCPGIRDGHYGLQGVRERAAHLNGEFSIHSNKTGGMKAVVSIKIPLAS